MMTINLVASNTFFKQAASHKTSRKEWNYHHLQRIDYILSQQNQKQPMINAGSHHIDRFD